MAEDAVLLRSQRLDGALGAEVEVVGPETHQLAAERLERVGEQQQLASAVDVAPLPAR
jgi:hypothetical protein